MIAAFVAAVAVLSATVATAISAGSASGAGRSAPPKAHATDGWADRSGHGREGYTIGLFGDMPYGALGRSQYPNLLADINRSHVAFSIFDGDLQAAVTAPATTVSTPRRWRTSTSSSGR